jgi:hypothetical protein
MTANAEHAVLVFFVVSYFFEFGPTSKRARNANETCQPQLYDFKFKPPFMPLQAFIPAFRSLLFCVFRFEFGFN